MSNIVLYTQPGCPICHTLKILLDKYKIRFIECQDTEILAKAGVKQTPQLYVDGKIYGAAEAKNWILEHR